jgi:hypothetical protein
MAPTIGFFADFSTDMSRPTSPLAEYTLKRDIAIMSRIPVPLFDGHEGNDPLWPTLDKAKEKIE